jgi:hypothetical protein
VHDPTPAFPQLLEVFNIDSKRKLEAHCRDLVVHRRDLTALILAGQHGVLSPYRYANHFDRRITPNLIPNEIERQALAQNGVGSFKTRGARKFATKVFQMFEEQRALAAHLFYTENFDYWYLFYFDNRDTTQHQNHWRHGSHIHLLCNLWPNLELPQVWEQVRAGELNFPSKLHLRYRR